MRQALAFEAEPFEIYPELGEFTPTPVETVGGGRIKDKRAPNPSDVVTVTGYKGRRVPLHRLAAAAWQALVTAARANGIAAPLLLPMSGYRNPERQAQIWRTALARYGSPQEARKWVAPPGTSAHQSGRAIDFYIGLPISSKNATRMRTLPAYQWLVANAHRFGFYPYQREPWHWEYNPPTTRESELAAEMYEEEWGGAEVYEDEGVGETFETWETGSCPTCGQAM